MSLLLVDTTFLIDTERTAQTWEEWITDDDDVVIAAVTIAELLVGVRLASGQRRVSRQAFVDGLTATLPVIAYDVPIARHHADLLGCVREAGRPRGAHDLIIAATARATGRIVVTADASGFAELPGVPVRGHR